MRSETLNIYLEKANIIIDYISANLHDQIKLDTLANQVSISQRQLLRVMRIFLNESLYAYISRQRVERAVLYMQIENMALSELANKVGYENSQSLCKAFKKQLGISPKAYMKELQKRLTSCQKENNNEKIIAYEINEERDIELVYIRIMGQYGDNMIYEKAWDDLIEFMKKKQLLCNNTRFIGISFDDPNITGENNCRFYACASVEKEIVPTREFGSIRIKKGKYAVYTFEGSHSGLKEFYNAISTNYDYNLRHGIAFEEYLNCENEAEPSTKIFIPIR